MRLNYNVGFSPIGTFFMQFQYAKTMNKFHQIVIRILHRSKEIVYAKVAPPKTTLETFIEFVMGRHLKGRDVQR
jgi:hypothetical protein